ncbi:MAG: hypothetical protein Q9M91_07710 [Candidatus Dojkabacteria bacterium]|nr:hypothetical protein [Candidatus Dojkabacteria bacterium]
MSLKNKLQNTAHEVYSEAELRFFGFFDKKKNDFDQFRIHPENFLEQIGSARVEMLRSILKKIGFKFNENFVVDLTMPGNVGGYFAPSANLLAINPWLLLEKVRRGKSHMCFSRRSSRRNIWRSNNGGNHC